MKSIVLYALTKGTPNAKHIKDYSAVRVGCCNRVWVRAEITEEWDVEEALHHAKPREGETVLNSIALE